MKMVLVGEAWGRQEEIFGHALVGASGRELASELVQTGNAPPITVQRCEHCKALYQIVPRCSHCNRYLMPTGEDMIRYWTQLRSEHSIAVTNVFQEHPPNNDLMHFFDAVPSDLPMYVRGKRLRPEARHHVESLWQELRDLKPNLIVAMGNAACWALLGRTGIMSIRGYIDMSERLGLKVLPTIHPASILRNWRARTVCLSDWQKAKREAEFREIRYTDRWITYNCQMDEIRAWMALPAERYAIDVESGWALFSKTELERMKKYTPGQARILSSQLSMVGFARSHTDALVIPFMTRENTEDMSYWPSVNAEIEAWECVRELCERPVNKIFQNGVYDMTRLGFMGIKCRRPRFDTMIKHHAMLPEMPKGLGFLGSIFCNERAWKQDYAFGESLKRDD